MEEFLTYVKLLIGVFGHKLLEEKIEIVKRTPEQSSISLPIAEEPAYRSVYLELFLNSNGLSARGIQTNEGIVVLKNSQAAKRKILPG